MIRLAVYRSECSEDLKTKSKRALKAILKKCTALGSLEPLMRDAPVSIVKYILAQFAKVLPNERKAKRSFVQSGGLQFVQDLNESAGGELAEHIQAINACFPPEIVEYYSPKYADKLMLLIDDSHQG